MAGPLPVGQGPQVAFVIGLSKPNVLWPPKFPATLAQGPREWASTAFSAGEARSHPAHHLCAGWAALVTTSELCAFGQVP